MTALLQQAIAAAAALTGKKFAALVATSVLATSGVVVAAGSGHQEMGPLAGLIGRSLASNQTAAAAPVQAPAEPEAEAVKEEPAEAVPAEAAPEPEAAVAPETAEPEAEAAPAAEEEPEEEETAPPPEEALPPGPVQHVFFISLAAPGYDAAWGATPTMPYLAGELRPQGKLLSGYSLLDDSAIANGIAAVAGQRPNGATKEDCPTYAEFPPTASANSAGFVSGTGCVYPVETLTLADQLGSAQLKWHAYMEDMVDPVTAAPANCVRPEPDAHEEPALGGYSSRLNPFAYFHSLLDLGDCSTNDVPLDELDKDLKKADTTANFNYISPTPCDAGVVGQCEEGAPATGAAAADAFLAEWAPKILKSPAFKKDGLLVVTFNQLSPPAIDPATGLPLPAPKQPLKVGTLLVSRYTSPGATDPAPYDPYSLLRSVEDLFRISPLAGAAKAKSFAPELLGENGGD